MTNDRTKEVTIDVFPLPQKDGRVMDGGDCGYCCIGGLFGHPTVLSAYKAVEEAMPEDGGWKVRESMSAYRMKLFLKAKGIEYVEFRPEFDFYKAGVIENQWNNHNWYQEFMTLIDSQAILYASCRHSEMAPPPPRTHTEHDHVVLINGYRQWYKPHPTVKGASSLQYEIRVSCSSKGDRWQDYRQFLYWHGCSACIIPDALDLAQGETS